MKVAVAAVLALGAADRHGWDGVINVAAELVLACDDGGAPVEEPAGGTCVRAMAVLWWLETRFGLEPPGHRRHGCGPGQVLPRTKWSSTRLGVVLTPPCGELERVPVGLAWALARLRLAWARHGSAEGAFRAYNGSARRDVYGRVAARLLSKVSR